MNKSIFITLLLVILLIAALIAVFYKPSDSRTTQSGPILDFVCKDKVNNAVNNAVNNVVNNCNTEKDYLKGTIVIPKFTGSLTSSQLFANLNTYFGANKYRNDDNAFLKFNVTSVPILSSSTFILPTGAFTNRTKSNADYNSQDNTFNISQELIKNINASGVIYIIVNNVRFTVTNFVNVNSFWAKWSVTGIYANSLITDLGTCNVDKAALQEKSKICNS